MRFAGREQLLLAPLAQGHHHREQATAPVREHVLLVRRAVRRRLHRENSLRHQRPEPVGQDVARHTQVALEVAEAADAVESVAHQQQGPAVAHQVERARHGAGIVLHRFSFDLKPIYGPPRSDHVPCFTPLHAAGAGSAVCLRQRPLRCQCVLRPAAARCAGGRLCHSPRVCRRRGDRHPGRQRAGTAVAGALGRPPAAPAAIAGTTAGPGRRADHGCHRRARADAVGGNAHGRHAGHRHDPGPDCVRCRRVRPARARPRGRCGARRRGGRTAAGPGAGGRGGRPGRLARGVWRRGAGDAAHGAGAVAAAAGIARAAATAPAASASSGSALPSFAVLPAPGRLHGCAVARGPCAAGARHAGAVDVRRVQHPVERAGAAAECAAVHVFAQRDRRLRPGGPGRRAGRGARRALGRSRPWAAHQPGGAAVAAGGVAAPGPGFRDRFDPAMDNIDAGNWHSDARSWRAGAASDQPGPDPARQHGHP
uniref:Uncharacterized protein n=1 Tax=Tanacetum cinerariifolium TaxID=118510 RepID=A0A699GEY1_TANCI|nr:hypothetical protein [Tanacetum cinerariifolium]